MRHTRIFVCAEVRAPLLTTARADDFMRRAVATAGMNVIKGPDSVLGVIPGNEGVSCTAILDFSSADLHEWPAHVPNALVHFSLYTCGDPPDEPAFRALFGELDPAVYHAAVVDLDELLGTGR